jgi:hypothetical protein
VISLSPLVIRVLASAGPASDFLCPLQLVFFLTIECLPRFFCSLLDPAESSNSFTPLSYSRFAFKPAAS